MDPIAQGLAAVRRIASAEAIPAHERAAFADALTALHAAPLTPRHRERLSALIAALAPWPDDPAALVSLARACLVPVAIAGGGEGEPPPLRHPPRASVPLDRAVALAVGGGARADAFPGAAIDDLLRELLEIRGTVFAFVIDAGGRLLGHAGDGRRGPSFARALEAHHRPREGRFEGEDGRGIEILWIEPVILAIAFEPPYHGLGRRDGWLREELTRVLAAAAPLPPLDAAAISALFDEP